MMNEKRILWFAVCLSTLTLSAFAQDAGVGKQESMTFKYGVKAGVNLATINNGDKNIDFSPSMKADFHVGAIANLHFGRSRGVGPVGTGVLGIQPELLYSRQGFSSESLTCNLSYITLSVTLKAYPSQGFYVEVGPYIGYLMKVSPASAMINDVKIKISDLAGGTDAGVALGLGFETKVGLMMGARYTLGLSDVANNLAWRNNVISLSLGWLF